MNKNRKGSKKTVLRRRILVSLIAILLVTSIGFLAYRQFTPIETETGLLGDEQTYSGENFSHSLDLRLAAEASYPSSALLPVKDLGSSGGVRRQIISFGVPTDGLTEYGLMMMPAGAEPAHGYPAVILCHGYINPAEYETTQGYLSDMEFYASHGFAVIKPDFRGQGLSLGQGQPDGAYYSMSYNTDVMSLITALKDTSYIDKSNINLWGHSMGAYIALRAGVISQDIKNTIILSGPVGSFKQTYLSYVPPSDENNPQALKIRNDIFSKYGTPAENSAFWINASPDHFLSRTTSNIQIHVGSLDAIVPTQLSADLDAALTSVHKDHQYYIYPDGRHGLILQRQTIWSRSLAVLQKN